MKIRKLETEQFAGLRLADPLAFTDGVNVITGKNESGKSTLVNLISRILFQQARLKGDAAKKFSAAYFPVSRRGSAVTGDSAEGRITLETGDGKYILSKVWGADAGVKLSTPDGLLRDQEGIDGVMKSLLRYGEGVWSELLLSPQKNAARALERVLDPAGMAEAKREITDSVSRAFAETGSLSLDTIDQAVAAKIDALGSNWDAALDAPARKSSPGRWQKNAGEVLKAYYALEDARDTLRNIQGLENLSEQAAADFRRVQAEAEAAEKAFERFRGNLEGLEKKRSFLAAQSAARAGLERMAKARREWPVLRQKARQAEALARRLAESELAETFLRAEAVRERIRALRAKTEGRPCPDRAEIAALRKAEDSLRRLEARLQSMNLRAAVTLQGGHTLEVTSLRTGEKLDPAGGDWILSEAVKLTIPGVMEMVLAPADLDVAKTQAAIAENRALVSGALEKYGVESIEALQALAEELGRAGEDARREEERLAALLGDRTFEALEQAYRALEEKPRPGEEIRAEILALCGTENPEVYLSAVGAALGGYEGEYGTPENLQEKIGIAEAEAARLEGELAKLGNLPEEGAGDPGLELQRLEAEKNRLRREQDEALARKQAAASTLESRQDQLTADPAEELERTEREFREKRDLLAHWRHIRAKLQEQKESIADHPLEDLAAQFARNLELISGGRVTADLPDADRLNLDILSASRPLGFDLLSDGTRETIFLAFRLAVVDHLFPEGGGVVVLDDPLVNMDAERTARACSLIRDCAKRHQVLFLTCREEYGEMLEGNRIVLE